MSQGERFGLLQNTKLPRSDSAKDESGQDHFKSRVGLVLSCLGCVIGTGNIWRFPRIVAQNSEEKGGLVFLMVWVLFLFLWSIPMLLIEYTMGRYTKTAIVQSFRFFIGNKATWCGAWVSFVPFAINSYYSVVLGWCFYYTYYCIGYELPTTNLDSRVIFDDFAVNSYWPILTHSIAILIAGVSVIRGVKTIEKVNLFLVPLFLLIVLFTFTWSLTRKYADLGIRFLFTPSWDAFSDPRVWVDAISQNAFDTGAGMGMMITYASYMTRSNSVVKYGTLIPVGNNIVSLICGITVFSTVFSSLALSQPHLSQSGIVDILKDSGPASTGLTFIWIPVLFSTVGVFGRVLAVLFFLCLSFAGVTSLIAGMELNAHTFYDFGIPRRYGMPISVVLLFLGGLASALDINFLTSQDFVWGFALIVNGMFLQFLVIYFGSSRYREYVVNRYGLDDWNLPFIWEITVKFVAPIEALALMIWWAVDLITSEARNGQKWYEFGTETFITTITQWLGVMVVMVILNVIILCVKPRWFKPASERPLEISYDTSFKTYDSLTQRETNFGNSEGRR
ncbi:uncharacterized sodium-dependent transporter YocR-like [Liolophura sinensis]|uniref:uncharacterized sodium-dependent transporter YocR-like n=1 Tax=Liolophura sinensis TaxID=3198878 RepID=UPI003158585E